MSEPLSRTVKAVRLFLLYGPAKKRLVGAGIARPSVSKTSLCEGGAP